MDGDGVEDAEAEPEEPVKILETQSTFDDFVVFGHEALPAADDMFVKGVEEWIQFADAVCFSSTFSYPPFYSELIVADCLLDAYDSILNKEWEQGV